MQRAKTTNAGFQRQGLSISSKEPQKVTLPKRTGTSIVEISQGCDDETKSKNLMRTKAVAVKEEENEDGAD